MMTTHNRFGQGKKRSQAILNRYGKVEFDTEAQIEASIATKGTAPYASGLKPSLVGVSPMPVPRPVAPLNTEQVGHLYVEGCYYSSELRYDMAIQLLNKAVELDVTFSNGWRKLAEAYIAVDAIELALNATQAVMALEPFDFNILKQAGILAEKLESWELASLYFKRYCRFQPQDIDALFGIGVALEHQEDYHGAIQQYQAILLQQPAHLAALNNVAGCHMQLNNYPQAIYGFEAVLERLPNFPRAVLGLGIAQDLSGFEARAIFTYRRYLALRDDGPHVETVQERLLELEAERP
jgi:tetratricopeptide (TPR) repeat protein